MGKIPYSLDSFMHSRWFARRKVPARIRRVHGFAQIRAIIDSDRHSFVLHDVPDRRGNPFQRRKAGCAKPQTASRHDNCQLGYCSAFDDVSRQHFLPGQPAIHRWINPSGLVSVHGDGDVVDVPRKRRYGSRSHKHRSQRSAHARFVRSSCRFLLRRKQHSCAVGFDCV